MAFFGISTNLINCGTPSASQKSESSDMTPQQAVMVAREVRLRGVTAAQQTYARLHYEYVQAYAVYEQLQADVNNKSTTIESYFNGQEAAARNVMEKAAKERIIQIQQGGNDYTHPKYQALVAGLSADRRRAVDEVLVPYYSTLQELEKAENALWSKHASMQAAQEVQQLWALELNAADIQLQAMPAEVEASAERNMAELRHLAQRVAEIRKKRILKRRKEKTVVRHLAVDGGVYTPQNDTGSVDNTQRLSTSSRGSKTRTSSAPPSWGFCAQEGKSKRKTTEKRVDFDASSWL